MIFMPIVNPIWLKDHSRGVPSKLLAFDGSVSMEGFDYLKAAIRKCSAENK